MCLGECELSSDCETVYMYYVNDGVYGSFNCILFDHAELETPYVEVYLVTTLFRNIIFEIVLKKQFFGKVCIGLVIIKDMMKVLNVFLDFMLKMLKECIENHSLPFSNLAVDSLRAG